MNLERMQALIRATEEAKDEDFGMQWYATDCGSPACVFGNYSARADIQQDFTLKYGWPHSAVTGLWLDAGYAERCVLEHFGITEDEAILLFSPHGCGRALHDKQAALRYLRAFVAERSK